MVRGSRYGLKSLSADRQMEEILCQTLVLLCGAFKCCTGRAEPFPVRCLHNEPSEITSLLYVWCFVGFLQGAAGFAQNKRQDDVLMSHSSPAATVHFYPLGLFPLDDLIITGSSIISSSTHHVGFPSSEMV